MSGDLVDPVIGESFRLDTNAVVGLLLHRVTCQSVDAALAEVLADALLFGERICRHVTVPLAAWGARPRPHGGHSFERGNFQLEVAGIAGTSTPSPATSDCRLWLWGIANALASTKKGAIFTNVALNLDDNTVWWEGLDKNPPVNAEEWTGKKVNGVEWKAEGKNLAHPNSRFTAPARNCPCLSKEFDNPNGVPISAFVFGGRRAKLAPLVYQSRDWNHGVFVGATMASETTAAAAGAVGVIRRDPMAMLPFCGYHMADYFQH